MSARGPALVTVLLTDGYGPLYQPNCTPDLRARLHDTINALDPIWSW
jgi:hypothetical protein